jgi:UDPglucose 6-dehydrogenase
VLTEWSEFRVPNLKIVKRLLNDPVLFDGRNIYDKEEMEALDFTYYCIGIKTSKKTRIKELQLAV